MSAATYCGFLAAVAGRRRVNWAMCRRWWSVAVKPGNPARCPCTWSSCCSCRWTRCNSVLFGSRSPLPAESRLSTTRNGRLIRGKHTWKNALPSKKWCIWIVDGLFSITEKKLNSAHDSVLLHQLYNKKPKSNLGKAASLPSRQRMCSVTAFTSGTMHNVVNLLRNVTEALLDVTEPLWSVTECHAFWVASLKY